MDQMTANLAFLLGLDAYQDRLQELLADDWPSVRRQVSRILIRLATARDDAEVDAAVAELQQLRLTGPAAELLQAIGRRTLRTGDDTGEAIAKGLTPSVPSPPSFLLPDPTSGQARIIDLAGWVSGPAGPSRLVDVAAAAGRLHQALTPLPTANGGAVDAIARGPGEGAVEAVGGDPTRGRDDGPAASGAAGERQINVWIEDWAGAIQGRLALGQRARLVFNVAMPVPASLTDGPAAAVADRDVPAGGLVTEWVVSALGLELRPGRGVRGVRAIQTADGTAWTARLALHIPRGGPSETRRLGIVARAAGTSRIDITILAAGGVYRQLSVGVAVETAPAAASAAAIERDAVQTPAAHLHVGPMREWQTPPGRLNIMVLANGLAFVQGESGAASLAQPVQWPGVPARLDGPITNVRQAAEAFRAQAEAYLNDIDPGDLDSRLHGAPREDDWAHLGDHADDGHRASWDAVKASPELRRLAYEGHVLYQTMFPAGSELRGWIDRLRPGHRISIFWQPSAGAPWLPHVPWGLMYLPRPPAPGQPVDPTGFLGLRFRIEYRAHDTPGGSVALGRSDTVYQAYCLYWGDDPADPTVQEARRQVAEWSALSRAMVLPAAGEPPKPQVTRFLNDPLPRPTAVVYLYCQSGLTAQGRDYSLQFGSTEADAIARDEIDIAPLPDRPLVFVNACTTSTAGPYVANSLEEAFFDRQVRGYVGTEARVPIQLAGRFATIFFRYFYRQTAPTQAAVAAGEAVAQARLFLWTNYRNIGGLFYAYVQQYELFMMDEAEISR